MVVESLLRTPILEGSLSLATPLLRADSLGSYFGVKGLYVKYEGSNPTGTQKDRAAALHVATAKSEGYDTITVGTCGNYGVSLAYYARMAGLQAVIYVPRHYSNERLGEMAALGAKIVLVDGSYEDAVTESSRIASEQGWYDANPGSKNWMIGLEGYMSISYEIVDALGGAPESVIVPAGNGSTLAGIYLGFKELLYSGVIERMPRIIATTTIHGNPIAYAYKNGLDKTPTLSNVKETRLNEPLVAMIAFDGDLALKAVRETSGFVVEVPDHRMARYSRLAMELEGICVLPASASTLEALTILRGIDGDGAHVVVFTGRCL